MNCHRVSLRRTSITIDDTTRYAKRLPLVLNVQHNDRHNKRYAGLREHELEINNMSVVTDTGILNSWKLETSNIITRFDVEFLNMQILLQPIAQIIPRFHTLQI